MSNKVSAVENSSDKHDLSKEGGPIRNRGRTDVICLLLFLAFLVGWVVVGIYAFENGKPLRLFYPSNTNGEICGSSGEDLEDRPYLLFFDLTKCLSPSVALGCPTKQVCVETCPKKVKSFWAAYQAAENGVPGQSKNELLKEMEPFCDPDLFENDVTKIKQMMDKQICPSWILPSSSFLGRCIPFLKYGNGSQIVEGDTIFDTDELIDDEALTIEKLKQKVEYLIEVLNLKTFGEKILADLSSSWWVILVAILLATFVSFMWIILMRFVAFVMVWSSILLSIGLLAFSCVYSGYKFVQLYGASGDNFDLNGFELSSDLGSYLELAHTWLFFLILGGVILLIVLLLLCFMWTRIKIAIELIEEASIAVGDMMSTLFFPVVPFVLEVIFVAWFLVCAAFLASWNEQSFHWNISNGKTCTVVNGSDTFEIKEGKSCTNTNETYETCTEGENVEAHCQFYKYGATSQGTYMQIYNLFGFFWGLFFLEALDQMVLAGAFASWYWVLDKKNVPKTPLLSSFYRVFRFHLGTLAFGSLIIAIIRMIRVMIEYIEEKLKEYHQDNPLVKCCLCFCKCCFYCLEKFMKFLNRNAYIMTAVYGKNFCWSAKEAFMLLFRNIARVFVLDKVTDFLLLLGKLVIVGGVGIASFFIFSGKLEVDQVPQLNYYFVPIIIITLSTYFIADIFFGVYEMGVDTLFLCFLEDIERNDGSEEKPYYMSKDLKKILGYMEDKSRPTSPS